MKERTFQINGINSPEFYSENSKRSRDWNLERVVAEKVRKL